MTTILVVDDDRTIRKLLALAFAKEGFDTVTAGNGRSALKQLETQPVDLVVTDIFMPEKDGLEFICDMKARQPNVKVIAISGGSTPTGPDSHLSMARHLGAAEIMSKPVSMEDLVRVVRDILNAEVEVHASASVQDVRPAS